MVKSIQAIYPWSDDNIFKIGTENLYDGMQNDLGDQSDLPSGHSGNYTRWEGVNQESLTGKKHRAILTYKYQDYSNDETGIEKSYYIGNYNVISENGVTFSDQGRFVMTFTHDDPVIQTIKWVKGLSLSSDGKITTTYNTQTTQGVDDQEIINSSNPLKWLELLNLNNDGTITAIWNTDQTSLINEDNPIPWLTGINLNNQGILHTSWNVSSKDSDININNPLQWLTGIDLNENGILTAIWNTKETVNNQQVNKTDIINSSVPLKWVTDINLSNDGLITAIWNTKTVNQEVNDSDIINDNNPLRWINSMNLTEDGYLQVNYNDIPNVQTINANDPIRYSTNLSLIDNGYLQATYNTYTLEQALNDENVTVQVKRYDTEIINDSNNRLKYITNLALIDNGYLQATYNTYTSRNISGENDTIIQLKQYDTEILNDENNRLRYITDISLDSDSGLITATYNTYSIQNNQRQYDEIVLNTNTPFKWITGISLTEAGNLNIQYNTLETETLMSGIIWPKEFSFNADTGLISGLYNDSNQPVFLNQDSPIQWVSGINVSNDGTISVQYNILGGNNEHLTENLSNKIKWINEIDLSEQGLLTISYNDNSTPFTSTIKWLDDITFSNNKISVKYNTDSNYTDLIQGIKWIDECSFTNGRLQMTLTDSATPIIDTQLIWPTQIEVKPNGNIQITNNLEEVSTQTPRVKWIDQVTYGDSTGLKMKFNTDTTSIENLEPLIPALNYVKDTKIDSDHHLLFLCSDQTMVSEKTNKRTIRNEESNIDQYWLDLGSIYEYSGILIGQFIDNSTPQAGGPDLSTVEKTIQWLDDTYPNGLTGDKAGKIVIVGSQASVQYFYAFNYGRSDGGAISTASWFLLGSLTQNTGTYVGPDNTAGQARASALTADGVWFITENWG